MTRLLLSLALFGTAFSAEPEKLLKLRSGFEGAVTRAVTPIQKTYLQELEKLKTEFTRAGNLEDALAVADEIKKLASESTSSSAQATGTKKSLLSSLKGTKWTLNEGQGEAHLTFKGNEVHWHDDTTKQEWTLKVNAQKDGSLLIDWGGASRRVEVADDLTSMTVARASIPDKKTTAKPETK